MIRAAGRQPRLRINRHYSHDSHQASDSLSVHRMTGSPKMNRHLPCPVERPLRELLVDHPHEIQIQAFLLLGMVIKR